TTLFRSGCITRKRAAARPSSLCMNMPATTAPGRRRCGSSHAPTAASPTASAAIRPPTCRATARNTARTSRATTCWLSVTAAGCGWGSKPDAKEREAMKALAAETGKMFAEQGIEKAAAAYADAPMRQALKHKDPRGYAEFARMLGEHSAEGHAQTMFNLQLKRP